MLKQILWYVRKFLNLCFVSLQLFFYGIFHPRRTLYELLVPMVQVINEYHQFTHSRLQNFFETEMVKDISHETIFAMSNVFNMDFNVTRHSETQVLSALVRYLKPKRIFEIGTYHGFTTLHMATNSPEDCLVYTLDLPPGYDQSAREEVRQFAYSDLLVMKLSVESFHKRIFKNRPENAKIRELFGNSMKFDFSPYYGQMDIVFVDGNHTFPFIHSDTENAIKMLSPQGIIIWHDFDFIFHRAIFDYLNRLAKSHKIYSVPKTRFALYGPNRIR